MRRPTANRLVRAATDVMWQRDRRQMAAIDAVVTAVRRRRRSRTAGRGQSRRASHGLRSVLCPVDFSEHSRLALRYAATLARKQHGTLTVLFVADPLLVAAAAAALNDRAFLNTSAIELKRFVDETIPKRWRSAVRPSTLVATGQAARQILTTATRIGADAIVVGTHGLTGLNRVMLGSTTLSVLRSARVPVLAVPWADGEPDVETWPGRRIAAAVALDVETSGEIASATRIAQWFGCSLTVIHLVDRIAPPPWYRGQILAASEARRIGEAKERLTTLIGARRGQTSTRIDVAAGRAADDVGIRAMAAGARLLIAALHDRRRWLEPRRGSIVYGMLTRTAIPILACPPNWRPA